jgi:cytochrome o ubiquinol oxidase subunit 3
MFFATIFSTYAVLKKSTFGGPGPKDLFSVSYAMIETFIMLTCAFIGGIGGVYAHRKNKVATIISFGLAFILGAVILKMIWHEFSHVLGEGYDWRSSAYLSAYFTLLGTFALHLIAGLLWTIVLLPPLFKVGITPLHLKRMSCLRIFWQFLSIVWVFIFTFVYLLGEI